jgi:hypothetical protein
MRVSRWLVTMALAVVFSGVAYADPVSLFTAPMLVEGSRWACLIVNVGDQTRTVTVLVNGEGFISTTKDLAPGQKLVVGAPPGDPGCTDGGCGSFYCAFKAQGGKHEFRAAICAADRADGPLACLPAE